MNDIVNSIKTQEQLDQFSNLLETLNASIYKSDDSFNKILSSNKSKAAELLATELLKPEVISSPGQKEKLISETAEELKNIKTIHITIAIPATDEIVKIISDWSQKKLKGNYLFDIEYDPSIVGGAQVSYDGRYMDDSLIKKIGNVFKEHKEEILTISNG